MHHADIIQRLRDLTMFLWIAFLAVLVIGALNRKRTVWKQSFSSGLLQGGFVAAGAYLLFAQNARIPWVNRQALPLNEGMALLGFALALCGIAFSVWARVTLGANWSGVITLKEDHTLIRRGPYRVVRHPLYTGILLALLGTALEHGLLRSLLGAVLCGLGLWFKSRTEEQLMMRHFGERYLAYRREVKALVPFVF